MSRDQLLQFRNAAVEAGLPAEQIDAAMRYAAIGYHVHAMLLERSHGQNLRQYLAECMISCGVHSLQYSLLAAYERGYREVFFDPGDAVT